MSFVSCKDFDALKKKVDTMVNLMGGLDYDMREVVRAEIVANSKVVDQSQMQFGLYTALCVDTLDIWKQNRIRFYSPLFQNPNMKVEQLPWANAVSAMGGFDDSGMTWVPPAGSTVVIMFENGSRSSPYYLGTVWQRNRGPNGQHNWGYNISEYYKIWEGTRNGYLVGPDDGSQVLPPWNTENYNGYDLTSAVDLSTSPESQRLLTYPNIYGFKTPEKHMIKMVDGDAKCNKKWKRFEIMSSCGNWIMLKDDHLHYAGQWANPECGGVIVDGKTDCQASSYDPTASPDSKYEKTECEGEKANAKIIGGHPSTGPRRSKYYKSQVGANPYFKHRQECRPYKGAPTAQNNSIDLPQSGIQFQSISGHTFVMDDSVEEPSGNPTWDREFDFGCNNKYVGRTYWKSATGHSIEMSDVEATTSDKKGGLRGPENFIRIKSASGNKIELNDHTQSELDCKGCPPNIAGDKRGILLQSTSNHMIQMSDKGNEQCGVCRREGGEPVAKAKQAFVMIRSGYGLEVKLSDSSNQEKAENQSIQIICPHKQNTNGPHILQMQEATNPSPGVVLLRVGGQFLCLTVTDHLTIVGDKPDSTSDKIEVVSNQNLVYTKKAYLNISDTSHLFLAKDKILLLAGQDCPDPEGIQEPGPCLAPVCVLKDGAIRASDRVFASASPDASVLSIFQLKPFYEKPPEPPPQTAQQNA